MENPFPNLVFSKTTLEVVDSINRRLSWLSNEMKEGHKLLLELLGVDNTNDDMFVLVDSILNGHTINGMMLRK